MNRKCGGKTITNLPEGGDDFLKAKKLELSESLIVKGDTTIDGTVTINGPLIHNGRYSRDGALVVANDLDAIPEPFDILGPVYDNENGLLKFWVKIANTTPKQYRLAEIPTNLFIP